MLPQLVCRLDGSRLVTDRHRNDGGGPGVESQPGGHPADIAMQIWNRAVRTVEDVQSSRQGGTDCRARCAGVHVGPGTLTQHGNHRLTGEYCPTLGTERLRPSDDEDVGRILLHAEMLDDSSPRGADGAQAVGVVNHERSPEATAQLREFRQWCEGAVHREHSVGDDETPLPTRLDQHGLQRGEIAMRENRHLGAV